MDGFEAVVYRFGILKGGEGQKPLCYASTDAISHKWPRALISTHRNNR